MGLIQRTVDAEPYAVTVNYEVPDDEGNIRQCCLKAIVDTGSPISLIKLKYVPVNCYLPVDATSYQYSGINNSRIELLGIFEKDVIVDNINVRVFYFLSCLKLPWAPSRY